MTATIEFILDGQTVEAAADETLWQVAKRLGNTIPHLCHRDAPGYRPGIVRRRRVSPRDCRTAPASTSRR